MLVVNMALFLVQRTVFVYFPGPDIELECTSLAQGIKRLCDHIRIQNSAKKKKKKINSMHRFEDKGWEPITARECK